MSSLEKFVLPLSSNSTLIAIMCLVIWYYWTHRKLIAVASRLPTVPLLSPLYFLIMGGKGFSNYTRQMVKGFINSGKNALVFWLGPVPFFFIWKPEDIQALLNTCVTVGSEADALKFFVGHALLIAPTPLWRVTRRHYQPVFHLRNLERLMPALNKLGRDLTLNISRHVGSSVDLREDIFVSSFEATCYLIFGLDFKMNSTSFPPMKFMKSISRLNDFVTIRILRFWLRSDFLFKLFYAKEIAEIETTMEELLSSAIQVDTEGHGAATRKLTDSSEEESKGEDKRESLQHMNYQDVFKTMRENDATFSLKYFKGECIASLIAGSETTQLTVLYCVLALAAHPDIQEAVYAEISATGRCSGDVTGEDLKAMTYLDQVVKETLRLFPLVPSVSRKLEREIKLSFGTLPAGATVTTASAGVHYNPKFYPDPDRFNPDNFSLENVAKRPKCTFLPFMAGPRNCIGQQFSYIEVKTYMVHLVRRFKFTTSVNIKNIEYISGMTYRPADLLPVELTFRN